MTKPNKASFLAWLGWIVSDGDESKNILRADWRLFAAAEVSSILGKGKNTIQIPKLILFYC